MWYNRLFCENVICAQRHTVILGDLLTEETTEEKPLKLGVTLEGENRRKFLAIKDAKGIKNNGEVVRLLINEFYLTLET